MNSDSTTLDSTASKEELFTNVSIDVDQLPKAEEVEFVPLSKKYRTLLHIYSAAFALLFGIGSGSSTLAADNLPIHPILIGAMVFAFVFVMRLIVVQLAFPWKGYAIREKDVIYRSGLLWRKVVTIPFSRIQHGELSEGLLERPLQIKKLKLYTAGGSSSDLTIPGIPKDSAEKLRAHIMNRVIEEAEVENVDAVNEVKEGMDSKSNSAE